ncbi:MAG: DUF6152 family protein [Candidatus Rariloculaceae bacterium]
MRAVLAIGLAGAMATSSGYAHHAASAVFSTDDIEIEGYVTEFNFKNPHVNIILDVTDENGVETEWMVTGPAAPPFRRWGWTAETIQPGQYLRIFGRKSRDGGPMMLMESEDINGGRIVELKSADGSIVRTVEGTSNTNSAQAAIPTLALQTDDGHPNLNGMWLGSRDGLGRANPPLNARAAAEQATFDPFVADPTFTECSDAGLVRQTATIHPLLISQLEDRLIFEYEEFAARREIYLDGRGPDSNEHTLFGHHVARYEGDALVIESSQLLGNLTGPIGNALSDQTTTVESYRRIDDAAGRPAIEMRMVITDPGNLTQPWEIGSVKYYTAEPYNFIEVECRLPYRASD